MQGWVKFYREWLDNPVIAKDCEHLAVWVYLLSNAAFEKRQVMFGAQVIALKAGEVLKTQTEIAEELKIDRCKVIRILKRFKNAQLIEQVTNFQQTLITLRLSGDYQGFNEQQNEQRLNSDCTAEQDRENEKEKRSKREKGKEKEIYKNDKNVRSVCMGDTHAKIVLGKYENVFVDKEWYEGFCKRYSYADSVIDRLSLFKEGKGIVNERDEPFLESFAIEDKEKYKPKPTASYGDADEFFELALARSYAK